MQNVDSVVYSHVYWQVIIITYVEPEDLVIKRQVIILLQ